MEQENRTSGQEMAGKAAYQHYRAYSAVFPIFIRTVDGRREVLLAKRQNTGYMDGKWDFAGSGHVDEGETATEALIREAKEELGITIKQQAVRFAYLLHRLGKQGRRTYYDISFFVEEYSGQPYIAEPEKCSGLEWFDTEQLPEEMIPIRKELLEACLKGERYGETVWEREKE